MCAPAGLHDASTEWPATTDALVAAEQELVAGRPDPWRPPGGAVAVAGCFVCAQRGSVGPGATGDLVWAAAALLEDRSGVRVAVVAGRARASYVPGFLALRDGPLLEAAVRLLPADPAVLLVNATGRDHPRRAGLAMHLGARLGIPTIGVTARPLVARGDPPGDERGAQSPLRIDGDVVGCWLRPRPGARPIAVHPGWRTDLETAVAVVMAATRDARTPEPLRLARRAAREARAACGERAPVTTT
jgi:deoxyribonuclease V